MVIRHRVDEDEEGVLGLLPCWVFFRVGFSKTVESKAEAMVLLRSRGPMVMKEKEQMAASRR